MRLIDADKLKMKLYGFERYTGIDEAPYEYAETVLNKEPTVDAIPVIRCKDCCFYKEENLQCMMHEGDAEEWYDNDYCSLAERKEE